MAYATVQDIIEYTGFTDLPDDISRLISRAKEVIDWATLNRVDAENEIHIEAAKEATCAQIEYWLTMSEDIDITKLPANFRIGSFSMGNANSGDKMPVLAPRARRHLLMAGLLYGGVSMK